MSTKIIEALIALPGIGVSAFIQYCLGRRNEKVKMVNCFQENGHRHESNIVSFDGYPDKSVFE